MKTKFKNTTGHTKITGKHDLPPKAEDDSRPSRNFQAWLNVTKKMSSPKARQGGEVSDSTAKSRDTKRRHRLDPQLPGESFEQFEKRLKRETHESLISGLRAARSTTLKRKRFLNQRKEKRAPKKRLNMAKGAEWTVKQDVVKFGEVAAQPPRLDAFHASARSSAASPDAGPSSRRPIPTPSSANKVVGVPLASLMSVVGADKTTLSFQGSLLTKSSSRQRLPQHVRPQRVDADAARNATASQAPACTATPHQNSRAAAAKPIHPRTSAPHLHPQPHARMQPPLPAHEVAHHAGSVAEGGEDDGGVWNWFVDALPEPAPREASASTALSSTSAHAASPAEQHAAQRSRRSEKAAGCGGVGVVVGRACGAAAVQPLTSCAQDAQTCGPPAAAAPSPRTVLPLSSSTAGQAVPDASLSARFAGGAGSGKAKKRRSTASWAAVDDACAQEGPVDLSGMALPILGGAGKKLRRGDDKMVALFSVEPDPDVAKLGLEPLLHHDEMQHLLKSAGINVKSRPGMFTCNVDGSGVVKARVSDEEKQKAKVRWEEKRKQRQMRKAARGANVKQAR